jgi:uncharacterized protein YnzC (UPF0291/DUF896 family)
MDQKKINRINELAKKSKNTDLTEQEKEEQTLLRKEYIEEYKKSLTESLDKIYILDGEGKEVKLQKKGE